MDRLYTRLSRTQIISLLAVSIPSVIFLDLAEDVWFLEGFWWDERFALALHSVTTPWLTQFVRFITFTGGIGGYLIFVILAAWLLFKKQNERGLILSVCYLCSALFNELLKLLFIRPRPALFEPLITVGGYSFPSGHSIAGITLYGVLAIFLWQDRRYGWAILAGIWAPLIGLSRVYLGVHYPSDVVAAWMAGTLWIIATFTLVQWFHFKKVKEGEQS